MQVGTVHHGGCPGFPIGFLAAATSYTINDLDNVVIRDCLMTRVHDTARAGYDTGAHGYEASADKHA